MPRPAKSYVNARQQFDVIWRLPIWMQSDGQPVGHNLSCGRGLL